jgi:hypothetical protein
MQPYSPKNIENQIQACHVITLLYEKIKMQAKMSKNEVNNPNEHKLANPDNKDKHHIS